LLFGADIEDAMVQTKKIAAHLWRLGVCCAVAVGAGAATWVDPPPAEEARANIPHGSHVGTAPKTQVALTQDQVPSQPSAPRSGIEITEWRFSDHLAGDPNQPPQGNIVPGRPLYLWMALDGTQAAIDNMRANQGVKIQVHWVRETGSGAPNLVTELTIGQPGLASTLEQQVRRQGFFKWHSWARKDALSPGTWMVSLTYPDGTPLQCSPDPHPCQFKINVG
jgi:hypothetical protein